MSKPGRGWGESAARGSQQASWGLSLAFGFVGIVVGCFFAGRLVDSWTGTKPVLSIIGAIGGFVLGTVVVYYGSQRKFDE
jgi:F0F1-type ATP synthase assembly protein I